MDVEISIRMDIEMIAGYRTNRSFVLIHCRVDRCSRQEATPKDVQCLCLVKDRQKG